MRRYAASLAKPLVRKQIRCNWTQVATGDDFVAETPIDSLCELRGPSDHPTVLVSVLDKRETRHLWIGAIRWQLWPPLLRSHSLE